MIVNVFIKNKIIKHWFEKTVIDLKSVHDFNIHNSIFSFSNELSLKENASVSLIDLNFENYFHYTNDIAKGNPASKFIGIGIEKTCTNIIENFNNNIQGYINIHDERYTLLQAIDSVANNNIFLKQENLNLLIATLKKDATGFNAKNNFRELMPTDSGETNIISTESLSAKEVQVCRLLTKGHSYKEIAGIIGFTTFAVNQKTKSIYKKLGVRSRSELSYKILN